MGYEAPLGVVFYHRWAAKGRRIHLGGVVVEFLKAGRMHVGLLKHTLKQQQSTYVPMDPEMAVEPRGIGVSWVVVAVAGAVWALLLVPLAGNGYIVSLRVLLPPKGRNKARFCVIGRCAACPTHLMQPLV